MCILTEGANDFLAISPVTIIHSRLDEMTKIKFFISDESQQKTRITIHIILSC